jgi:hypothetical protein
VVAVEESQSARYVKQLSFLPGVIEPLGQGALDRGDSDRPLPRTGQPEHVNLRDDEAQRFV